jgi:hypothetical protein
VVAAGIRAPSSELRTVLVAHARSGATIVTDDGSDAAWWRIPGIKPQRQFDDRAFYGLGNGRILAYKEPVVDPGDFALDVLDLAADRRPVRLWDAPAAIAMVSQAKAGPILTVVNYGSPTRAEIMAHVRGQHRSATLLRPGEQPGALQLKSRGGNTEIMLSNLQRLAVVVFE